MKPLLITITILAVLLGFLFWQALSNPAMTVFSNDGPLGQISSDQAVLPNSGANIWADLNWFGAAHANVGPLTTGLRTLFGIPLLFVSMLAVTIAVPISALLTRFNFKRAMILTVDLNSAIIVTVALLCIIAGVKTNEDGYLGMALGLLTLSVFTILSPLAFKKVI